MPTPKNLPSWFMPLMRRSFGIGPRPPDAPRPAPKWFLDEKNRFIVWIHWLAAGRPTPRPSILWRNAEGKAISPKWAGDLRKALIAAGKLPGDDPPVPTPIPPKPVVVPKPPSKTAGKNGLYYYNATIDQGIAMAKAHGLSYIAILVNETNLTPYRDGRRPEGDIFAERDRIKNAGLLAIATGWAEPFGDLEAQAQFIGHMAQGFDEYMLNIEAGWTFDAGIDAFLKSDVFAPRLRHYLGPDMPLSICPDWGNNIHWKPYIDAGLSAIRVQCYMNEWPHKDPKRGLGELLDRPQHDLPNGVPKGISREACYGKYAAHNDALSNWSAQDDAAGRPPRTVWAAEFCTDPDAAWLSR